MPERFWVKVEKGPACWNWIGALDNSGYGSFWDGDRVRRAHRVAWELDGRVLDDVLGLDHLCDNKRCVRPDHLEQVTNAENNVRRSARNGGQRRTRTEPIPVPAH